MIGCPRRPRPVSLVVSIMTVLLLSAVLAGPAWAQNENETTGFSSTHVFDGGHFGANSDTLNGNLTLTFPIGPSYQVSKNLSYQLKLVYNSKVWEFVDASGDTAHSNLGGDSPFGLEFSLSFGRLYQDTEASGLPARWYFVTPDGNRHDMGNAPDPADTVDTTYFLQSPFRKAV